MGQENAIQNCPTFKVTSLFRRYNKRKERLQFIINHFRNNFIKNIKKNYGTRI